MSGFDVYQLLAQDHGVPDGWHWYKLRGIGNGTLLKGAVCNVLYKSGKWKGQKNWTKRDRSTEREFVFSCAEVEARRLRYERETGNCYQCGGDGKSLASWNHKEGIKYRDCSRCGASGKAPQ